MTPGRPVDLPLAWSMDRGYSSSAFRERKTRVIYRSEALEHRPMVLRVIYTFVPSAVRAPGPHEGPGRDEGLIVEHIARDWFSH